MKFLRLILITVAFTLPILAIAQGDEQKSVYENQDSPVDLLASYYDAINLQQYQLAYGYWENAPIPYSEFVDGFSDTIQVQLIVQPPTQIGAAVGSRYVNIPTVLIAEHVDGTEHTYSGCFTTRKSNLHPPDIPKEDVWHLYDANLEEVSDTQSIPELLANACDM